MAGLALALSTAITGSVTTHADEPLPQDIDYTIPANPYSIPDYSGSLNAQPRRPVGGMGVLGRFGHEAGDTVGRAQSVTYFDAMPYSFNGDWVVFGDGRLYIANSGNWGGNAGLGFRHFMPSKNSILGATFYYDHDESRKVTFEQFTIAGEWLSEFVDVRANVHIPFGNKQQVTGVRFEPGTQMFVDAVNPSTNMVQGSNILFQTRTFSSLALEGVDLTLSVPVMAEWAQKYQLEASAGAYHYQVRGMNVENITGFKLRGDADFLNRLSHMYVELTSDNTFKTNVVFGVDINYWNQLNHEPRIQHSQYSRLASWVRRTRTVSTFDTSNLNAPELAINPIDNEPYLVYHVRNDPARPVFPFPQGNGSEDTPFQYMQEAIDAAPLSDIVFVHANSVFDGTVDGNTNSTAVLRDGLLVLGEGVPLSLPVVGQVSEIDLPSVTMGAQNRPVIQNVTGPVATMFNDSRFAGFSIQNYADGPAISADGITNFEVNELIIDTSTGVLGHGIEINNVSGGVLIENVSISNTSGDAFRVTNGDAQVVWSGTNTIANSSGFATLVRDAGGLVSMRNTTITGNGGSGILIESNLAPSTADVIFDTISLTNTVGPNQGAFQVDGHGGSVTVLGDLGITGPTDSGLFVNNLQSTGILNFIGPVTITNRQNFGMRFQNLLEGPNPNIPNTFQVGSVNFIGDVNINGHPPTIAIVNGVPVITNTASAISMESNTGFVAFQNINIDQSNGFGISIDTPNINLGNSTGRFFVSGLTTITRTSDAAINIEDIRKANFQTTFTDVLIDQRATQGIRIVGNDSRSSFIGTTVIDNSGFVDNLGVFQQPAIEALLVENNDGNVGFRDVDVSNAIALATGDEAVLITGNRDLDLNEVADIAFSTLDVEFIGQAAVLDETAIRITDNQRVQTGGGVVDATDAEAILVTANDLHNLTFQSITASNDNSGIDVFDSVGVFRVSGLSDVIGSGGTIDNMAVAGARFVNTQVVDLNFMDIQANNIGISLDSILVERENFDPIVIIDSVNIEDSVMEGIFANNVSDFMLLNSIMDNNGTAGLDNQIDFLATTNLADIDGDGDVDDEVVYNVDIIANNISDGQTALPGDMILIRTGGGVGINGVELNLNVLNNGIPVAGATLNSLSSNRTGAALNVNWDGPTTILIDNNTFNLSAVAGQTGVRLNLEEVADVTYTNNNLNAPGFAQVGLDFDFDDAALVNISDNVVFDQNGNPVISGFQMFGEDAVAMSLLFDSGGNDVFIGTNLINLTNFDTVGISIERIFAPSTVIIDNNVILNNTNFAFGREEGIIFRDVRGVINIGGANNSVSLGTFFPFFVDFLMPAGTNNGQIEVNGSPRP